MLRTIFLLALATTLPAAELSVTGDWYRNVDSSDLAGGAGSDLSSPIVSASGVCVIHTTATGAWMVKVRRSQQSWPAGATLWVRRSSGGSGSVTGGEAFIEVGATDVELFSGSGDCSNIAIQMRVLGLSAAHTPGQYSSAITFTIQ